MRRSGERRTQDLGGHRLSQCVLHGYQKDRVVDCFRLQADPDRSRSLAHRRHHEGRTSVAPLESLEHAYKISTRWVFNRLVVCRAYFKVCKMSSAMWEMMISILPTLEDDEI